MVAHPPLAPPVPHHHAAHNGPGSVGLVLGALGVMTGAIAFLFPVAGVLGVAAVVLGAVAVRRVRHGRATNRTSSYVALAVGGIAVLLAVTGLLVSVVATEEIAPPPPAPPSPVGGR